MDNTRRFEHSILSSVLTQHYNELQSVRIESGLRGPLRPFDGFHGVTLANKMQYEGMHFHAQDVVAYGMASAGVISACAAEGLALYLIVQPLEIVGEAWQSSARFRLLTRLQVVPVRDAREVTAWYRDDDL